MIPTLNELLTIYSKAMAAESNAKYITDRMEAGLSAVRDAVLEGVAESSAGYHVLYVDPGTGLSIAGSNPYPLADYIRSLKGSSE